MKFVLAIVLVTVGSYVQGDTTADLLVDKWLQHISEMLNSTNSENYAIKGFEFNVTNKIYLQNISLNIKAGLGAISGLTTLRRFTGVELSDSNDGILTVSFELSFNSLVAHYPTIYISGPGVKITYNDVLIKVEDNSDMAANFIMTLDYSSQNCTNKIGLDLGDATIVATVTQPPLILPVSDDLSQRLDLIFKDAVVHHIQSVINYEKICYRLLTLI